MAGEGARLATVLKDGVAGHGLSERAECRVLLHRCSRRSSARPMVRVEVVADITVLREDAFHHILVRAERSLILLGGSRDRMVLEAVVASHRATADDRPRRQPPIMCSVLRVLLGEELACCVGARGAYIVWELRKRVVHLFKLQGGMHIPSVLPASLHLMARANPLAWQLTRLRTKCFYSRGERILVEVR